MLVFLLPLLDHVIKLFGKLCKLFIVSVFFIKNNGLRWALRIIDNYLLSFSYLQIGEISVEIEK